MHGRDAGLKGRLGRRQPDRHAVEEDLARIRREQAGQNLDQGGLARSILAEEGVDFAGLQVEVDVHQGVDAGKGAVQPADFQHAACRQRGRVGCCRRRRVTELVGQDVPPARRVTFSHLAHGRLIEPGLAGHVVQCETRRPAMTGPPTGYRS